MCEYCDDVCELNWKYGLDHILPDYRYCPMCGALLIPEEPLTLEELWDMIGQPAYFVSPDWQGFVIVQNCWVYGGKKNLVGIHDRNFTFTFDGNSKTYRHKPIEEDESC